MSTSSITMHNDSDCLSIKASLYEIIFGCYIEARILTSLIALSFSLSDKFFKATIFKAYN
jgi:hypothetical protein